MADKKIIAVMGATGAQGGGLVRAIAADSDGPFVARAVTRKTDSDKAQALKRLGVEVVSGDADDPPSLERAFAGAYAAYAVTNFWEHNDPERESRQATAMARASKRAGLQHVVWSTLEDTRLLVPVGDDRLPTLMGKYKVPHFDAKAQADAVFANEAAPTTYLLAAFYWENFIHFGLRSGPDGTLVLALPLGGARLPGIAAEDIGKCAYGIFERGPAAAGQRIGIAGETLSGPQLAEKMSRALGRAVTFQDVPFDLYRGLGFPGAEDLGNMFEYQALLGEEFYKSRSVEIARELNPELQDFGAWLARHAKEITLS